MPIYLLGSSGVLGRSLGVLFGSMPLAERNLATMWSNYRALGYRRLVYLNTASVLPNPAPATSIRGAPKLPKISM